MRHSPEWSSEQLITMWVMQLSYSGEWQKCECGSLKCEPGQNMWVNRCWRWNLNIGNRETGKQRNMYCMYNVQYLLYNTCKWDRIVRTVVQYVLWGHSAPPFSRLDQSKLQRMLMHYQSTSRDYWIHEVSIRRYVRFHSSRCHSILSL
jgi:hypothetical protein